MAASRTDPTQSSQPIRGYLFVVIAVVFWAGSASVAKIMFQTRFDALIVTQMRTSLSFLMLALFFALTNRPMFKIAWRLVPALAIVGVFGVAATNFSYYYTVEHATIATAILIQNTAPVLVALYLGFITKEESFTRLKAVALVLALGGCYLAVTGGGSLDLHLTGWTRVTAFAASFCYAFQLIYSKRLLRTVPVWTFLMYAFGFAGAFWLFINPPWAIAAKHYSSGDWGVLLFFAVFSILIPHSLLVSALKLLEASRVAIVTTLEPFLAILFAYIIVGESIGVVQVIGGIAIISAVVLLQLRPHQYLKKLRSVSAH
ncbi:MAG: DMT family transporter [Ignavibacteriales bacterium]|nr:DMT family transporter [Ignavibacteriales bacterium]